MGRHKKFSEYHEGAAQLVPKTHNQELLIKAIEKHPITLAIGPAGCGKTYVSAAMAAKYFYNNYVDRIVRSDGEETFRGKPEVMSRVQLKDSTWALIREGLHNVVQEGTGQMAKINGAEMYGKTGTAQNPQGKDHAWFVAYATVDNQPSKVAVAVLVEHGLHGASAAAPIAKAVIEAVLRKDIEAKLKKPEVPASTAAPAWAAI